jgi:hypothetical protein
MTIEIIERRADGSVHVRTIEPMAQSSRQTAATRKNAISCAPRKTSMGGSRGMRRFRYSPRYDRS